MELNTLPSGILTKILQYLISPNDTNNYGRKSDDLKVLRTISCSCRAFFTLLQQDQTWRTMYPSSKCNRTSYLLFSTSLQERHYIENAIKQIRRWQLDPRNILQEVMTITGVDELIQAIVRSMCPRKFNGCVFSFTRGSVVLMSNIVQEHVLKRMRKANCFAIHRSRVDSKYPEVSTIDLKLLHVQDEIDSRYNERRHHELCSSNTKEMAMDWTESVSDEQGQSGILDVCPPFPFGWKWLGDAEMDNVLVPEIKRRMVRALAFRAGIVKLSGCTFREWSLDVLHYVAVLAAGACEEAYRIKETDAPLDYVRVRRLYIINAAQRNRLDVVNM